MTDDASRGTRSPYAAYGPASAGYGPRAATAPVPTPAPSPGRAPNGADVLAPPPATLRFPPPAPPPSRGAVGVVALVAACIGAAICLVPFGGYIGWVPLVVAVILALVQVGRTGAPRRAAVAALIVAGIGTLAAVLWALVLVAAFGGGSTTSQGGPSVDERYEEPRSEGALVFGDTATAPLPWGAATTLASRDDGSELWSVAIGPPEDITEQAVDAGAVAPASGQYVAVPVQLTNTSDDTIDLTTWRGDFYSDLSLPDGSWAVRASLGTVLPSTPSQWSLDPVPPGATVTYYDVWDAAWTDAVDGAAQMYLFESGETREWGGPLP